VFLRGPSLPLVRVLHHDYPLTPQIWGLLNRERFDCLVIGGWSLLATQLAILWARLHGVPYLLISENHFREERPLWVRAVKRLVLPRIVRPAAGHLVTGSLAREHALAYGARRGAITVFPNTVDVDLFGRRADELRVRRDEIRRGLGVADDAVLVLQVSRLIPFKGPDEVLEAVAAARSLTARRLHLVLVGDGPMREELEARAARHGLDVSFTGLRQGDALLEAYAAADVFALFSRREPWGIVVNEAMACGLPLVLSDRVGAAADLLVPGENGELVRSGDVADQARALAKLADDDELRARYGRRSRELIRPWGYAPSVEAFADAVRAAVTAAR
jgi:glycosyltransferase involved in cell wall biosynthesis